MTQRAMLPLKAMFWGGMMAVCLVSPASSEIEENSTRPAQPATPLSVIDWLGERATGPVPLPRAPVAPKPKRDEPAVSLGALPPTVTVAPLGEEAARQIGLVPSDVTGLPTTLWQGSNPDRLIRLIETLPAPQLPAAQALLYRVLLTQADAPQGIADAGDRLALARVDKLMTLGALDPAGALIEQAGVPTSPAHFALWMRISLLTGTEDRACALWRGAPHLAEDYDTAIFCAARAGRWDDAALTFGSAQALGLLPEAKLALLDRFLHPDAFEGTAPLPAPRPMDPLSFRLFETIGERLPTRSLPVAYAAADLRDVAGWKAQLEAAERLTRAGALPANVLLGLYTARKPAASGGVWDRAAALQRFDTALRTQSVEAVAKTLPAAWRAMQAVDLEVAFATLFAESLADIALEGQQAALATRIALLSPEYETAAGRSKALARDIARGAVAGSRPSSPLEAAIFDAFKADAEPRTDLIALAQQDRLGESILRCLGLLHAAANGDLRALRDALATLRALGLEGTSRKAALQILLLEGQS